MRSMSASERSRQNVFAGMQLDRCSERRADTNWVEQAWHSQEARFVLVDAEGKTLANAAHSALHLLDGNERQRWFADAQPVLLGVDTHHVPYFALASDSVQGETLAAACGCAQLDLRRAGLELPAFEAGLFAYARGLLHWQSRTRWCGTCGHALVLEWAGHRARCSNPACALEHYPRTDPAIIVIVSWRDACLLGRQASWPAGRFSTLAGFVEPGETLEDAVRREVFEEAGVRVVDCDYHSSQRWPFPSSLMLAFTARAEDPSIKVGEEIDEARWFEVDDFVRGVERGELKLPPPLSVSWRLIAHWLRMAGGLELAELKRPSAKG